MRYSYHDRHSDLHARGLSFACFRAIAALSLTCILGGINAGCISSANQQAPDYAIHIGTVLPFSGSRAASGVALESALRLAMQQVNEAGGLGDRRLWLDVRDSHSDDERGTASALELIESTPIPFFIGTEEPKIAYQITSAIKSHEMVHLMPGLTSPRFHDPSASAAWFRLAPSSAYIACALGKHMVKAGVATTSLVIEPDDYNSTFATMFGSLFITKGGSMLPTLQIDPQGASYRDTFAVLEHLAPDAVALVCSPTTAAVFLQEWAVRGRPFAVYLGPTLNSPELLRNVPAGVLDGMKGVSADLGEEASRFESYFLAQTQVASLAGANYYFDAVALLSLAVAEGIAQTGAIPAPSMMKDHIVSVSSAGGTTISFDQLAQGLDLLADGQKIEYHGAAGTYVLTSSGDSTQNRGAIWQIDGDEFVTVDYEQCDYSELQAGGRGGIEL
jgi:branched-chain amino acid transport system substrate-binding protein